MKAKYDAVRRTLAEANRVLTAQDFDRALAMFEKGLADLGADYATAKTICATEPVQYWSIGSFHDRLCSANRQRVP